MSLPDEAEYWWDVKGYSRTSKHTFTHIKGVECGHYHVHESNNIKLIDCRNCKKILADNVDIKQELAIELKKEIEYCKQLFKAKLAKKATHGLCTCGYPYKKRINMTTGNEFLGCYNYPRCKNTKPIK